MRRRLSCRAYCNAHPFEPSTQPFFFVCSNSAAKVNDIFDTAILFMTFFSSRRIKRHWMPPMPKEKYFHIPIPWRHQCLVFLSCPRHTSIACRFLSSAKVWRNPIPSKHSGTSRIKSPSACMKSYSRWQHEASFVSSSENSFEISRWFIWVAFIKRLSLWKISYCRTTIYLYTWLFAPF